jgi:hypothetical protein
MLEGWDRASTGARLPLQQALRRRHLVGQRQPFRLQPQPVAPISLCASLSAGLALRSAHPEYPNGPFGPEPAVEWPECAMAVECVK